MSFSEMLEYYLDELDITAKELSDKSGLSASIISRYKNAERLPNKNSVIAISNGLKIIASEKQNKNIDINEIELKLLRTINFEKYDVSSVIKNFNLLIESLEIKINKLAKATNYDPSYISRIRTNKRAPKNLDKFFNDALKFICETYNDEKSIAVLCDLIDCNQNEIDNFSKCFERLKLWLFSKNDTSNSEVGTFLKKLDDFDLNEFIRSIHFDTLKVPKVPFILPTSKNYYSLEGMKQAELDFLKATVLSKSNDRVFMYSNMQMDDMAKDLDFSKKWMFGVALMLKKGLHLDMIHNLNRPFNEMMLGLESWMPIYMTGQITPYYIKGENDNVFSCLNYCSGAAALYGECIVGHHKDGKYYLSKSQTEVSYYRKKADFILQKASSLMDIYDVSRQDEFNSFLTKSAEIHAERNNILTAPPIYTLDIELLDEILVENNISQEDKEKIKNEVVKSKLLFNKIIENNKMTDSLTVLSKDEFNSNNVNLSLSTLFYEKDIKYTYEQYQKHINLTNEQSKISKNYSFVTDNKKGFNNIEISILKNKWVVISKNKSPAIHFVIKHKKLLNAISNLVIPIVEE